MATEQQNEKIPEDRWATKFGAFVRKYGVEKLVTEFRKREESITVSAVYYWVRGTAAPRPRKAAILVELSATEESPLTLEDIYSHAAQVKATA